MTEKKKVGSPPKDDRDTDGVADMQRKIDADIGSCKALKEDGQHPTVTGLAIALDMGRLALLNYEGKPEFVNTVKAAKERVGAYLEQHLYGTAVTGAIFNLKNNFSWRDTTHQEVNKTTKVVKAEADDLEL